MDELQAWGAPITGLGVAAILAWFMWYTTSTLIPGMHREHTVASEKQHTEHLATVERICDQFTESLREERTLRAREAEMMRAVFRCRGEN